MQYTNINYAKTLWNKMKYLITSVLFISIPLLVIGCETDKCDNTLTGCLKTLSPNDSRRIHQGELNNRNIDQREINNRNIGQRGPTVAEQMQMRNGHIPFPSVQSPVNFEDMAIIPIFPYPTPYVQNDEEKWEPECRHLIRAHQLVIELQKLKGGVSPTHREMVSYIQSKMGVSSSQAEKIMDALER